MDKKETTAPIPDGGGDGSYDERVSYDSGEQFEKSEHTCLEWTSCEKKWNNQNYNKVKDNSVEKDLELKLNIGLFCC